jgi:hypothetical protein
MLVFSVALLALQAQSADVAGMKCFKCGKAIENLKLAGWVDMENFERNDQNRHLKTLLKAFDEPGCMIRHRAEDLCAMEQIEFDEKATVVDYNTGKEVPFGKAFFAKSAGIKTPNGYGIAAFTDRADAEAAGGTVLTIDDISRMGLKEMLK